VGEREIIFFFVIAMLDDVIAIASPIVDAGHASTTSIGRPSSSRSPR
jgi:hypothetical protein